MPYASDQPRNGETILVVHSFGERPIKKEIIYIFKTHFKWQKPTLTKALKIISAPSSQNGHSTNTLLQEAITLLWRYAELCNLRHMKALWLHFLLVSITQNDQTDTLWPFCQSGSHVICCHSPEAGCNWQGKGEEGGGQVSSHKTSIWQTSLLLFFSRYSCLLFPEVAVVWIYGRGHAQHISEGLGNSCPRKSHQAPDAISSTVLAINEPPTIFSDECWKKSQGLAYCIHTQLLFMNAVSRNFGLANSEDTWNHITAGI